jgi:hypothetical protein
MDVPNIFGGKGGQSLTRRLPEGRHPADPMPDVGAKDGRERPKRSLAKDGVQASLIAVKQQIAGHAV